MRVAPPDADAFARLVACRAQRMRRFRRALLRLRADAAALVLAVAAILAAAAARAMGDAAWIYPWCIIGALGSLAGAWWSDWHRGRG